MITRDFIQMIKHHSKVVLIIKCTCTVVIDIFRNISTDSLIAIGISLQGREVMMDM